MMDLKNDAWMNSKYDAKNRNTNEKENEWNLNYY